MKYLILSILTLGILYSPAQKKISYDLTLNAGIDLSRTKSVTRRTPGIAMNDITTGIITIITPGGSITTNTFKSKISPQSSLGAKINYSITNNITIHGGLGFTYLKLQRENTMPLPIGSALTNLYDYTTIEIFDFYNLDIPIGARYTGKKWSLDLAMIPSLIFNSKVVEKKPNNPEAAPYYGPYPPTPTSDNEKKIIFSASITPAYQASEKVRIGIEYVHGLTDLFSSSSGVYQEMKMSTLGLKILYRLN